MNIHPFISRLSENIQIYPSAFGLSMDCNVTQLMLFDCVETVNGNTSQSMSVAYLNDFHLNGMLIDRNSWFKQFVLPTCSNVNHIHVVCSLCMTVFY